MYICLCNLYYDEYKYVIIKKKTKTSTSTQTVNLQYVSNTSCSLEKVRESEREAEQGKIALLQNRQKKVNVTAQDFVHMFVGML